MQTLHSQDTTVEPPVMSATLQMGSAFSLTPAACSQQLHQKGFLITKSKQPAQTQLGEEGHIPPLMHTHSSEKGEVVQGYTS